MYYYSTVNEIVMTHSAIIEQDGFDFLDMNLPGEIVYKSFGFSEDEVLKLKKLDKAQRPLPVFNRTPKRSCHRNQEFIWHAPFFSESIFSHA